jgi:hypothetical protein
MSERDIEDARHIPKAVAGHLILIGAEDRRPSMRPSSSFPKFVPRFRPAFEAAKKSGMAISNGQKSPGEPR